MRIPFPVSSAPGEKPQEGGGRLINCHVEKTAQGASFPLLWGRAPGLRKVSDNATYSHHRGSIVIGATAIVVRDNRATAVTLSGGVYVETDLGALSGSGRVTIARNNAATANIVCVTENGPFNLFTASPPTTFADGDLPTSVKTVASFDGYLLFTGADGKIWNTGLNSVSVGSNAFITAESDPDGLLRGVTFGPNFWAFGQSTIEVYYNAATSPSPLARQTVIERGLAGTNAVAGWEQGWSNSLIFAADDNRVYEMQGFTPVPISEPDLERLIAAMTDKTVLEASVYMSRGAAIWTLTNPGVWTWEYNRNTQSWSERVSDARTDWRATGSFKLDDKWFFGDRVNGKLYEVDPDYRFEDTDPLVMTLESGVPESFPGRGRVNSAIFNFTTAVGLAAGLDPIQTDPVVEIEISPDGGYSWDSPLRRELGSEGASNIQVKVNRLGIYDSTGPRFRLTISDPVHVALMASDMNVQGLSP